jgi:hypothetical protein
MGVIDVRRPVMRFAPRAVRGYSVLALSLASSLAAWLHAAPKDPRRVRLPIPVQKAIDDNRPGARIAKLEIATANGIVFYDLEFADEQGEMDVAQDGTVLDISTVVEMGDVPESAAALLKRAAHGTTIRQLTRSEVRARIEKVSGKGKLTPLVTPAYVYEAELLRGGEVEVGADGRLIKGPKSLRKSATPQP